MANRRATGWWRLRLAALGLLLALVAACDVEGLASRMVPAEVRATAEAAVEALLQGEDARLHELSSFSPNPDTGTLDRMRAMVPEGAVQSVRAIGVHSEYRSGHPARFSLDLRYDFDGGPVLFSVVVLDADNPGWPPCTWARCPACSASAAATCRCGPCSDCWPGARWPRQACWWCWCAAPANASTRVAAEPAIT